MISSKPFIYLVGVDPATQERLKATMAAFTSGVRVFDCAESFMSAETSEDYACVIAALDLPDMAITDFVSDARQLLPVIVLGRTYDLGIAVRVMRAGAANLLDPRIDARQFKTAVVAATKMLQPNL